MDVAVSVCEVQCDIIDYAFSFCHTQQKTGRGRYQENQQDIDIDIDITTGYIFLTTRLYI